MVGAIGKLIELSFSVRSYHRHMQSPCVRVSAGLLSKFRGDAAIPALKTARGFESIESSERVENDARVW